MIDPTPIAEAMTELRNRAETAEAKLASLSKVIDAADKLNDASTDNQVAASASLHEAIAYQMLEQADAKLDKAEAQTKLLVEALGEMNRACGSCMNWMEQVSRAKLSSATRGILTVDIGMCSTAMFKAKQALSSVRQP